MAPLQDPLKWNPINPLREPQKNPISQVVAHVVGTARLSQRSDSWPQHYGQRNGNALLPGQHRMQHGVLLGCNRMDAANGPNRAVVAHVFFLTLTLGQAWGGLQKCLRLLLPKLGKISCIISAAEEEEEASELCLTCPN